MQQATIVFFIALYRNDDEVIDFVKQLAQQEYKDFKVWIVCNEFIDEKKFREQIVSFDFVNVVVPVRNLGYFGAAHYGLKHYLEQFDLPELIVVCNTDLKFTNTRFLNDLVEHSGNKLTAAFGPSIVSKLSGKDMNPYLTKRYTKSHLKLLKSVYSFYPLYLLYELLGLLKSNFRNSHQVVSNTVNETYAVYGAFIAFTKSFFQKGGTLNYDAFLYGEEIFVAEQARQLDMKILYDSNLKILHDEHSTTGYFKSPTHVRYLDESIAYILKTFYADE